MLLKFHFATRTIAMSIIKKILAGFNAFKSTLVKNAGLAYFNPNLSQI